jgi:hypothetical protein
VAGDRNREDQVGPDELVCVRGGTWSGLLFDNPRLRLPAHLYWSFDFPFADIDRSDGSTPVSLELEWIPVVTPGWRDMAGRTATVDQFADPGEASVYFLQHHRFDSIALEIIEQAGPDIRARVTVSGDLDRLGLETVTAEAWLRFQGLVVSVSDVSTGEEALARLAAVTDTTELVAARSPADRAFRFAPGPAA